MKTSSLVRNIRRCFDRFVILTADFASEFFRTGAWRLGALTTFFCMGWAAAAQAACVAPDPTTPYAVMEHNPSYVETIVRPAPCLSGKADHCFDLTFINRSKVFYTIEPTGGVCANDFFNNSGYSPETALETDWQIYNVLGISQGLQAVAPALFKAIGKIIQPKPSHKRCTGNQALKIQPGKIPPMFMLREGDELTFCNLHMDIGESQQFCAQSISNPLTQLAYGLDLAVSLHTGGVTANDIALGAAGLAEIPAAMKVAGTLGAGGENPAALYLKLAGAVLGAGASKLKESGELLVGPDWLNGGKDPLKYLGNPKIKASSGLGALGALWSAASAGLEVADQAKAGAKTDAFVTAVQALFEGVHTFFDDPSMKAYLKSTKLIESAGKYEKILKVSGGGAYALNLYMKFSPLVKAPHAIGIDVARPPAVVAGQPAVWLTVPADGALAIPDSQMQVRAGTNMNCQGDSFKWYLTSPAGSKLLLPNKGDRSLWQVPKSLGPHTLAVCVDVLAGGKAMQICSGNSPTVHIGNYPNFPPALQHQPLKVQGLLATKSFQLVWKATNTGSTACKIATAYQIAPPSYQADFKLFVNAAVNPSQLYPGVMNDIVVDGVAPQKEGSFELHLSLNEKSGVSCGILRARVNVKKSNVATSTWHAMRQPYLDVDRLNRYASKKLLGAKLTQFAPEMREAKLVFKNAGTLPWNCGGGEGPLMILTHVDQNDNPTPIKDESLVAPTWLSLDKVGTCSEGAVGPGEVGTFYLPLQIGSVESTTKLRFGLWAGSQKVAQGAEVTIEASQMQEPAASISLLTPNGGEKLTGGSSLQIAFSSQGAPSGTTVQLKVLDGLTVLANLKQSATSGSVAWLVPSGLKSSVVRVRAELVAGSEVIAFDESDGFVGAEPICVAPPPPWMYAPGSLIVKPEVSVAWEGVLGAAGYELQYSTNGAFVNPTTVVTAKEWSVVNGLVTGNYSFRVRSKSSCGLFSPWSNVETIPAKINQSPTTPTSPSPPNGAQGVTIAKALSWQGGDSDGGTVQYQVWIGSSPNNLELALGWMDDKTSYVPQPPLLPGKTYYWQVKTKDDGNLVTSGPVWSFTTANEMADVAVTIDEITGTFKPQSSLTIKWTAKNTGSFPSKGALAKLYLSKAQGQKQQALNADWLPVPPLAPGESKTVLTPVKIAAIDAGTAWIDLWADTATFYSDANLANHLASAAVSYKDEVKPTITQITVVGSNVCHAGVPNCFQKVGENIHFVAVSKDDTGVATMDVEWSADGASGWTSIVQGCKPGSSGYQDACSWKPPLSFVKPKVWFRISVADSAGNSASSVFGPVAVIDGSGPVIAFAKPATGASYKLGDTVDVAWSASSPNGVKKVSLSLLTDAAQQCNCNLDTVFSEQPDPSKAAFKIPMSAAYVSKAARFRLTVWDNFGASTKVMSEPFQIADASFPVAPWTLPLAVSGSGTPGRPVCSLAPDGNIRLVYRSTEGGYASGPIAMRTINGGQLGAIETVGTAAATVAQHMATATSPDGKTVIAWSEDDKAVRIVEGTPGAWSNKVTPSPLGVSLAVWPTAAAGVNGRMVCWSDFSKAVFCAHSSNFGVGVKILDDTTYPNLLATNDGKFLLVATGALSQQLKITRLDGTQILSSVALAKGPYDFWRAAIGEDGSEVLARPENNTGEAKGVYFHPLLGDKLGAQEVAKYAIDGGASLALSSDALGRWIQFARSGEAGQAKLVVSTTRLASGWSVPAPIVPATLAGAGDYPPAVCRGKDGRLHLFFDANGAIQYTHALHQLDTAPPELDWLSPASDAELVIGQTAPLSWSSKDESGVASVKIEWSKTGTTGPWSTVGDKLEAASSLDWPVPALPKTEVHFRLTATDSLGQSAIKVRGPCLIVDKAPPEVAISAPLAGEKLVGGSEVALMWTAKDNVGVVLVDVSMSTDGGLSWKKIAEPLAEDVALKVTLPKIDAKDLRLRVSATDAAGLVGSATVGPMALEVANTPPVAAYAPSPVDGAVDVGAAGLALAWLSGDPDVDTTLTYDIWLGATGGELVKVKAGVTEPQFAPPGLQPGTKYQWRITASDGKATVDGPVWTFTTLVPPPAGLDALTVLGTTAATVTLTWTGPAEGIVSIERSLEGAEQYAEVGTSAAKDGAWTDKAAAAHTTYVYRARRKAGLAWSNYTPPAQATTANTAPSTPLLVAPALNATGLPPKQVTLSWQATDADGDPLAVDVYLGTNAQPTLLAAEVTGTSLVLDELAYSSVYFWRIVVSDPAGGTAQSSMSTFITAPPPLPEAPSKLTAKLVDDITLELTWDDNSTVENGFRVEMEGAKGWETIATTAWSATTVNPVAGVPTMTMRVVAFNESGDSAASNSVIVKLTVAPPGSDAGSGDVAGDVDAGGWDSTPGPDAGGLSDLDTPGDASGDLGSDLSVPPEDASKSDLATTADGVVPGTDVAGSVDVAEVIACSSDASCDDGDPCTKDNCIAGACGHAAVFGCCKSDSACKSGQGCVSGVCKAVALCSACKVDADCGTTHAKCVDFGAEGSGCLPVCGGAKVCGPGTQCEKLGSLEVCVPKSATCKCAPTEDWTCSADGKTKVLLDACKGIVKGSEITCSAGCVGGACVEAADATSLDDAPDSATLDADSGPHPASGSPSPKDGSGCRAGPSPVAASGAWILLAVCLTLAQRRKRDL